MRRVLLVLTAALSAAIFLGAAASASAGTLDQQQTAYDNSALGPSQTQSDAQTFTAGLTGGLDQVDLVLARVNPPTTYLTVEIRDVSGGVPGQAVLAARSVPPAAVTNTSPQFIPVQFNPPAPVVAGTQYAIVVYSGNVPTNWFIWYVKLSDVYSGGLVFTSGTAPPSTWTSAGTSTWDAAFKTYVVPTPSPTSTGHPASTGQRAAALKKCKKKHSKRARRKCRKKANLLPV
jgi:hypothetical protein